MKKPVYPKKIIIYSCQDGKEPFLDWFYTLDVTVKTRIRRRLDRLELGNLGDCASIGDNVYELRFFFGSGYRIYFGLRGDSIVLLLCGGDKKSQTKDIVQAKAYWKEYWRLENERV